MKREMLIEEMMKEITVKRIGENDDGVFGVILDGITPFALTLENPDLNNLRGKSCIPVGEYLCVRYSSTRYPDTFIVTNVPDRDYILFHVGNTDKDTAGCILVAEEFGELNKKTAILSSKKGFAEFMERLKGFERFLLKIEKHYGEKRNYC